VSNQQERLDSMRIFRQGLGPYALAEAMTGVRLGERLLYLGSGDPALFAALAAKAGLTGRSRALVDSEAASVRIKEAAARAGVYIEVAVTDWASIEVEPAGFDVTVVDAVAGPILQLDGPARLAVGRAAFEALRPRGRAVVVERDRRGVLAALKGRPAGLDHFRAQGGASALLEAAGFRPVRLLADQGGERFTEGWKSQDLT
jgi:hypothetical protein